jgi:hypothetical protein
MQRYPTERSKENKQREGDQTQQEPALNSHNPHQDFTSISENQIT